MKTSLKRSVAILMVSLMCLTGAGSFAQGLDTVYMDLMLEALRAQPPEERAGYAELLKITLYDADTIEITKSNYTGHLSEGQKAFLEANRITSETILKNLEALKTWSFTDRMALVDAAQVLNKTTMLVLNGKYTLSGDPALPNMPTDEVKAPLTMSGISIVKPVLSSVQGFRDLTKHWSLSYVTLLTRANVIAGYPDGTYSPEVTLTRAEVITMLVKAFSNDFRTLKPLQIPTDLKSTDWHYDFMTYAAFLELYQTVDGKALPNEPLTREKTANILANMAQVLKLNSNGGARKYSDVSNLSTSSQEDLQWLSRLSIFSGYPDGTFKPNNVVTRAEASVLVLKMMQLFYGTLE